MAGPAKPPNLDPNHVYIHVTSSESPSDIAASLRPSTPGNSVRYIGPVGELAGEHIFELHRDGSPLKRAVAGSVSVGQGMVQDLKGVQGVKGAKVLEVKQRAKRGGEF